MPPVARPAKTCARKVSMGSVAQVGTANRLVGAHRRRLAVDHDATGLEEVSALGELERKRRVLLDEQDRDLLVAIDGAQDLENVGDDERRQAEGRLIEEQ